MDGTHAAAFPYVLTSIGHRFRRCNQLSMALFSEEVAPFGVTTVQYAALAAIAAYEGIDATRLAALIALDRSTVGAVLERLEDKALVSRYFGAGNKRNKLLRATASGCQLLERADGAVHRSQDRFVAVLDPLERATLLDLLDKLLVRHVRHVALDEAV